eukprot:TRINITY_DN2098_c0_g2_i1.p2 TRINITY_DN2098_c0_g2~~TRINITY_DN2098_c0_g2_i1.p2  ORF type:complete len:198 (-),score=36.02 TRINITY_DN2098_c0_g2_i1:29-622(-)
MLDEAILENFRFEQVLEEFFHICDVHLEENGMEYEGTTCTILLLANSNKGKLCLYIGNVGDSKAIVSQSGVTTAVTESHNTKNKDEVERVSACGAFVARGRVNGVFSITRALGNHCMKAIIPSEPKIKAMELDASHSFACVASDGLWDVINPQQVSVAVSQGGTIQQTCEGLVASALEGGSHDNISTILIKFGLSEK